MRLPWLAGCAIIAMLPLLWLPVLPGPCSLAGAGALALALIRLHGRAVAGVAMTLLLVVWGSIERASGAVADPAPYRRHPASGSDP